MRVVHQGIVIAESTRCRRVLETASPPTIYIPPGDVRQELLASDSRSSECEWKGPARHWHRRMNTDLLEHVAWCYLDPYPEYDSIRGYFSFYPSQVDCYVGGHRVLPQQGNLYGGWITSEVVGPFKGRPGTEHW